jgi:hypothetical protein
MHRTVVRLHEVFSFLAEPFQHVRWNGYGRRTGRQMTNVPTWWRDADGPYNSLCAMLSASDERILRYSTHRGMRNKTRKKELCKSRITGRPGRLDCLYENRRKVAAQQKGHFLLLGAFVKFRRATSRFVMFVRLCVWNDSAPTGRISIKFDIWVYSQNLLLKFKFR